MYVKSQTEFNAFHKTMLDDPHEDKYQAMVKHIQDSLIAFTKRSAERTTKYSARQERVEP